MLHYSKIGTGLFLALLFIMCVPCSSSEQVVFQRTYGGSLINEGRSVQQTLDGGYIIAGSTSSFGYGATDVLLIKTDSLGNGVFMKTYGGSNVDIGYSVLQLSDSGYVVAGYTNSFGNGGYDAYLVRTDKNGDTLWTKTYGGADWDFVYSLKQTSDGGFVMAGNTYSYGNGSSDAWVLKTNSNGDSLWQRTFITNDDAFLNSIDSGFNNRYITAGYETNAANDSNNIIAASVSSKGDYLWFYSYEDTLNIQARVVHSLSDSIYLIGGRVILDSVQTNGFLLKIDTNGHQLWVNEAMLLIQAGLNDLFDFVELPNSNFVLAATNTFYGGGGIDIYQEFTDSDGNYLSAPSHGGLGTDIGYSINRTSDNGFIMVGETNTYGPGLKAVYLVKTDSLGHSTAEDSVTIIGINKVRNENLSQLKIFPNPCKDHFFIQVPKQEAYMNDLSLSIFDVLGKMIYSMSVFSKNIIQIDISGFSSGVYVVELKRAGEVGLEMENY